MSGYVIRRGFTLTLLQAGMFAGAGFLLLLFGIGRAAFGTSAELVAVQEEQEAEREVVDELERKRRTLSEQQEQAADGLAELADQADALERALQHELDLIQAQQERQRLAEDELRSAIITHQTGLEKTVADLDLLQERRRRQQEVSDWLVHNQRYLFTIFLPDGRIRSGIQVYDAEQEVVLLLTDAEGLPGPAVHFQGTVTGPDGVSARMRRMSVREVDPISGLASLGVVGGAVPAAGLVLPEVEPLAVGDTVFSIGAVQLGGHAVQYSMFDGSIAAAQRQLDGLVAPQLAVPVNAGTQGSLVLDASARPAGMVLHRTDGFDTIALLATTSVLRDVMQRF